ncbi:MAG: ASKHA domain-containing protein, partial [Eubacteriales bacterium]|nr:ASKHA domain-containing protein [Eubacteriales bacterium]
MKITLKTSAGTFIRKYEGPIYLYEAIKDCGITVPSDCGGRGVCGKCAVEAYGEMSPITDSEKLLLGEKENFRLACMTKAVGDVQIIYNINVKRMQVLAGGISPDIKIKNVCGAGIAVAIDIGTTTVAAASYDLATGKRLDTYTYENPQRTHGADVVTRMDFASHGGLDTLKNEINGIINEIQSRSKAKEIIIAGNTAMLHFAAGLSTDRMSKAPFETESLFGYKIDGIYYAPCASAYFGSDVVCGMAACEMDNNFPSFIADIGTNGEMAVFDGGRYYCCSTAAGPCFEGYGIECGMPAVAGAVNRVFIDNGIPRYTVIDGEEPRGLCGSGLADYTACLLELGIIDKTGYMSEKHCLCENVYITPRDVRNLQLAKAAIRAGIETLLDISGTKGKIKAFYLAGGMGNSIDINSAVRLGLIPGEFAD